MQLPGPITALLYALGAVLLLAGLASGMQWLLSRLYHEPLRTIAENSEASNPGAGHRRR